MATEYLSLTIHCSFCSPARLPVFKGSTLHGAFGRALKKISCTLKNQGCQGCLLAKRCAYHLIFATEKLSGSRTSARPHPYILNPPVTKQQQYQPDECFSFNLVLLGPALAYLAHIVYTIEEMGKNGLGAGSRNGAGLFTLQSISIPAGTTEEAAIVLYDAEEKILRAPPEYPRLNLDEVGERELRELCVELVTPLRIKSQNRLQGGIDFSGLVRTALRRVTIIEEHYGNGELKLDYQGLIQQSFAVQTISQGIRWHEYKRYSNRQKQSMFFGGLMGHLHFQGDLAPFLPLLTYCCHTNLGKQTAFGLGKIRLSAPQSEKA
jgi:hypothetical protein